MQGLLFYIYTIMYARDYCAVVVAVPEKVA